MKIDLRENKPLYRRGKRIRASNVPRTKNYCEGCGLKRHQLPEGIYLERHHRVPLSKGGKDVPENITILCTLCHILEHPEHREFMIAQAKRRKVWGKW